ncbi:MAG: hypothetical protein K2H20_01355 [Bacilli bacterium]|nr:hypothetical protein [Bacilli bacterium]
MYKNLNMFVIEKEINKNVAEKGKQFEAMCRLMRTTKEYHECKKLYDIYVVEIANYLHNLGIKNSEHAVIYLDLLLRNGMLSITGRNDYHLYKNDKEFLCELFGARSIGGISVCRHMSALTADILNIEYYSSWLNGKYIFNIDEIESKEPFLHAIVGVVCEGGKIIYDPTSSSFAAEPKDIIYSQKSQARIAETFTSFTDLALPGDFILLNNKQFLVNPTNEEELVEVWYTPLKKVDKEEFDESVKTITTLYNDTYSETAGF